MSFDELSPTAEVRVLTTGYVRDGGRRVASTCSLITDGGTRIVVDPGLVADPSLILDPLADLRLTAEAVTDVTLSHHHPDHTVNAALFPNARIHDYWAVYHGDSWESRRAEGVTLAPSVLLLETPGHSPQDITVVAATHRGTVAFTHCWWSEAGPASDPFANQSELDASRERILSLPGLVEIVPAHGAPFAPRVAPPR